MSGDNQAKHGSHIRNIVGEIHSEEGLHKLSQALPVGGSEMDVSSSRSSA